MTRSLLITTAILLSINGAEARPRKHVDANGNPVGRFICGLTQRKHFGLTDKRLNTALYWAKAFPHVSAQPGAVVVQRRTGRALGGGPGGHVSRIESVVGQCRAIVTDERGTYERDVCRNLVAYVMPSSGGVVVSSLNETGWQSR